MEKKYLGFRGSRLRKEWGIFGPIRNRFHGSPPSSALSATRAVELTSRGWLTSTSSGVKVHLDRSLLLTSALGVYRGKDDDQIATCVVQLSGLKRFGRGAACPSHPPTQTRVRFTNLSLPVRDAARLCHGCGSVEDDSPKRFYTIKPSRHSIPIPSSEIKLLALYTARYTMHRSQYPKVLSTRARFFYIFINSARSSILLQTRNLLINTYIYIFN